MTILLDRFGDVLEITLTLSVVIALLLALRPRLGRRYRAGLSCWVWLAVAVRLVIPFNLSLPQAPVSLTAEDRAVAWNTEAAAPTPVPAVSLPPAESAMLWEEAPVLTQEEAQNPPLVLSPQGEASVPEPTSVQTVTADPALTVHTLAALIWLAGGAAFLVWQLAGYARFRLRVRRWRSPEEDPEVSALFERLAAEAGVGDLTLARCAAVPAPMVTGLLCPVLLLPPAPLTGDALEAVLRHEITHVRRRDLWYKLLLLLARAVHWFNPLVHLMARRACRDLEIACDEAVVAGQDAAFRARYGRAVLDAVEAGQSARAPLTTYFHGGRRALRERLSAIVSAVPRRRGIALLCAAAVVVAVVGGACSVGSGEPVPDSQVENERYTFTAPAPVATLTRVASGGSMTFLPAGDGNDLRPLGGVIRTTPDYETGQSVFYDTAAMEAEGGTSLADYARETPDLTPLLGAYGVTHVRDDRSVILPLPVAGYTVETLSSDPGDLAFPFSYVSAIRALVEREGGGRELHYIYCNSYTEFYDLWFDLGAVTEADADAAHDTLILGTQRTASPDGSRTLTLFPGLAYLYDTSGEHPVLLARAEVTGGVTGLLGLSDPLWSPDGTRAAVTVEAASLTTFAFPLGPFYPESQSNYGLAELLFQCGHPFDYDVNCYSYGDVPVFQHFVPLAWAKDSLGLQFSYEWLDSEGRLQSGTAWYRFDENNAFTGIDGVEENPAVDLSATPLCWTTFSVETATGTAILSAPGTAADTPLGTFSYLSSAGEEETQVYYLELPEGVGEVRCDFTALTPELADFCARRVRCLSWEQKAAQEIWSRDFDGYTVSLVVDGTGAYAFQYRDPTLNGGMPVTVCTLPGGPDSYPYSDTLNASAFDHTLGSDGFVLFYGVGAASSSYDYYAVTPGQAPRLLARCYNTASPVDLDGDGDRELLTNFGLEGLAWLYRSVGGQVFAADCNTAARQQLLIPGTQHVALTFQAQESNALRFDGAWGADGRSEIYLTLDLLSFVPVENPASFAFSAPGRVATLASLTGWYMSDGSPSGGPYARFRLSYTGDGAGNVFTLIPGEALGELLGTDAISALDSVTANESGDLRLLEFGASSPGLNHSTLEEAMAADGGALIRIAGRDGGVLQEEWLSFAQQDAVGRQLVTGVLKEQTETAAFQVSYSLEVPADCVPPQESYGSVEFWNSYPEGSLTLLSELPEGAEYDSSDNVYRRTGVSRWGGEPDQWDDLYDAVYYPLLDGVHYLALLWHQGEENTPGSLTFWGETSTARTFYDYPKPTAELLGLDGEYGTLFDALVDDRWNISRENHSLCLPRITCYGTYEEAGGTVYVCSVAEAFYYDLTLENRTVTTGAGNTPAALTVDASGRVTEIRKALDGEGYASSVRDLCGPLTQVADAMLGVEGAQASPVWNGMPSAADLLRRYVEATGAPIDTVCLYGTDFVPLSDYTGSW